MNDAVPGRGELDDEPHDQDADASASFGLEDYVLDGGGAYMLSGRKCSAPGSCYTDHAFSPPMAFFPASTATGYSETVTSSVTGVASYTSTRVVTVGGIESVTVPAGTFSALKVTAHITDTYGDRYNVTWWVSGIGRVKIVNYPASSPSSTSTWAMTGHGVAAVP